MPGAWRQRSLSETGLVKVHPEADLACTARARARACMEGGGTVRRGGGEERRTFRVARRSDIAQDRIPIMPSSSGGGFTAKSVSVVVTLSGSRPNHWEGRRRGHRIRGGRAT